MEFKEELISTLSKPASGIGSPQFEFEQTPAGKVGGFIISPTFATMTQINRQNMVWEFLEKEFPADKLLNIVTLVTITPAESNSEDSEQEN